MYKGTLTSYAAGFILSIALTLFAYLLVMGHVAASSDLMIGIVVLAIAQLCVQLVCFLHVGKKSASHWNSTALAFAAFIVVLVVGGSLWIMNNLQHGSAPELFNGHVSAQTQIN